MSDNDRCGCQGPKSFAQCRAPKGQCCSPTFKPDYGASPLDGEALKGARSLIQIAKDLGPPPGVEKILDMAAYMYGVNSRPLTATEIEHCARDRTHDHMECPRW